MLNQRRILVVSMLAVILAVGSVAFAGGKKLGPPHGTIYAHDRMYRTIGTPAMLPDHGKFDMLYVLGDDLAPVADAAPGDREFNGGRWEVHLVEFLTIPPTQFTNAEDIRDAAMSGEISIGPVAKRFECPMIPTH
jgi:hypothetical protein